MSGSVKIALAALVMTSPSSVFAGGQHLTRAPTQEGFAGPFRHQRGPNVMRSQVVLLASAHRSHLADEVRRFRTAPEPGVPRHQTVACSGDSIWPHPTVIEHGTL